MRKWKNSFKAFTEKRLRNYLLVLFLWAFLVNLIIETLARKNIGGLLYLIEEPIPFLYNSFLIFTTLSVAVLFRRRAFFVIILSGIWLGIGTANGIILIERMTPFTVKDLSAATDAATILTNYFSKTQLIGIAAALVALVVIIVLLWIKAPKAEDYKEIRKHALAFGAIVGVTLLSTAGLIKMGILSTFFGNLAYAYADYGVPYCFVNTWLNTGISKPSGYSQEEILSIVENCQLGADGTMKLEQVDVDEEYPNILFLQLESFVDPTLFTNIQYSADPVPNFRAMTQNYSSGWLTVPACGAGTANTEFEVMTGLSVKFFGPGEYPFKSVLKDRPAESIAFDLKSLGYSTHAIHNHRAQFYNRNTVFANIGYDTFTSLEYMSDVAKTPKNWAKDSILTSNIMDALAATESRDYVYTISVQGHGKYPGEQLIQNPKISVTDAPTEELRWKYEYYANQVYEMDQFVKDLTDALSDYDEPVVLVLYGDHIPALDVEEANYNAKDLYQTQYVIWSNFEMDKEDQDLCTYQLAAEVFDRVGIHTGTTVQYHQNTDHSSATYLSGLEALGYDMLYGKGYIYGGENPFQPTDMKMGVKPISIEEVVSIGGNYYIKGENFTEYSKVTLRGETLSTTYLGPNLLGLNEEVDPLDAEEMKVSQIDKTTKDIISTTE